MTPAQQLGPYRLIERIGKGGMGEVWKARDTRLDREVAIKISAEQFCDRFEREARAIAALNHPNICTLFDVGPNYLVMELIDGPTLADRIAEGPIPLEEALVIAHQIADALEAAHEKNIVHRDLKPANIKLRPDGSVKVLDFGLAKASGPETVVTGDSPTMLNTPTQMGVILGTAAYMAPEQARGKNIDKRADIWSFGVVLHEMVTGKRLFEGEDLTETLASVVKSDPDLTPVPQRLRRLLTKCLQKDPKNRLRDIGDAWDYLDDSQSTSPAPSQSRPGTRVWMATTGVFALIAAALALVQFRQKPVETPVIRSMILPPENTAFSPFQGSIALPAVSPDGRRVVFAARTQDGKDQLWVRSLDSTSAQPLAGTANAYQPFWSPDGKSIGFFAGGKLNRIDAAGGTAVALADAASLRGASWSAEGVIVFAPNGTGPLRKVPASGGAISEASRFGPGESTHRWPWFLPDGRHFLFSAGLAGLSRAAIRLGSLDSLDSTRLLDADSDAIYAAGYLLFLHGDTLIARPFDAQSLRLSGEALPVVGQVQSFPTGLLAAFSASANGLLAYMGGTADFDLAWFDRKGNRTNSLGEPAPFQRVKFSPDQRSLAVSITDGSNTDIWLYDVARGLRTRFTFDQAVEEDAVWSPDGKTIIFDSSRRGPFDLYRKAANGSGAEELLYADQLQKYPASISPDSKSLLYTSVGDAKTGFDLWILPDPLGEPGAAKPWPFLRTQFNEENGQFSPDGHWIAYQSDESGRWETYVVPFPGPGGKRQISAAGGVQPRWRADGMEIFYIAADQRLTAAEVTIKGGGIETGEAHPLFGPLLTGNLYQYDVSADGQRILAVTPRADAAEAMTIVQNWTQGLKK